MTHFADEARWFEEPESLAQAYLARYFENREIKYPINPFQMLKDEGVLFSFMNFRNLEGVYIPATDSNDVPLVGINARRPITRQRFTAAHELCHHFRDAKREISCPLRGKRNNIEIFAEKFAAALLMPLDELNRQVIERIDSNGNISFDDVLEIENGIT